jgi:hypothetical protein
MALADRYKELGMVPVLATELAAQMNGGTKSVERLTALSMIPRMAREIVNQMISGVFNAKKLIELGMAPELALVIAEGGGGGGGPVEPFFFEPETQAIIDQIADLDGTAMPDAQARRLDRAIWVIKNRSPGAWGKFIGLYLVNEDTIGWSVNLKEPGTYDLVKNGNPTYTTNNSTAYPTIADFYDTGIPQSVLDQNSASMAVYSRSNAASSAPACGALATGSGIAINTRNGTPAYAEMRAFGAINPSAPNNAGYWSGIGWHGVHRINSTTVAYTHHGKRIATLTQNSVASDQPTRTITIGKANGAGSPTVTTIAGFYVTNAALTQAEAEIVDAALQDYIDSLTYGVPYIEEVGIGTPSITADVIVYGLSMPGFCAAYDAARQGLSVAMIGAELDETIGNFGGHPGGGGLNWLDCNTPTRCSGLFREVLRWCNVTYYSRADTTSQANLSVEARAYQMACRRMVDPTRTTGILPGFDIKVYMSGGIASVTNGSDGITSAVTADGRILQANVMWIDASYDGEMLPVTPGVPYLKGTEATGTGEEVYNGYKPQLSNLIPFKASDGTALIVDPYVIPGDPTSGLLPDTLLNTQTGANGPNLALQSMNYRLSLLDASAAGGNAMANWAPLLVAGSPPPNYDPARYEFLGRICAAATAAGKTIDNETWMHVNNAIGTNNALSDFNSLDRPMSGIDYLDSMSKEDRIAIQSDVKDYMIGALWWTAYSGDSRIPAGRVTFARGLSLTALTYLDPPSYGWLNWPANIYKREPRFQLVGDFILNANDLVSVGTPRSIRAASNISYRDDKHDLRRVAQDSGGGVMSLYRQGALGGDAAINATVPMDVCIISAAKNLAVICAPSWTKIAHSAGRMEFTLGLLGQFMATAAFYMKQNDITDINDIDYDAVRALVLAAPYNVPAVIPQTNG